MAPSTRVGIAYIRRRNAPLVSLVLAMALCVLSAITPSPAYAYDGQFQGYDDTSTSGAATTASFADPARLPVSAPAGSVGYDYDHLRSPDATNAVGAVSDNALAYATRVEKLDHIFVPKHNLDALVTQLGSREAVVEQMLRGGRATSVLVRLLRPMPTSWERLGLVRTTPSPAMGGLWSAPTDFDSIELRRTNLSWAPSRRTSSSGWSRPELGDPMRISTSAI